MHGVCTQTNTAKQKRWEPIGVTPSPPPPHRSPTPEQKGKHQTIGSYRWYEYVYMYISTQEFILAFPSLAFFFPPPNLPPPPERKQEGFESSVLLSGGCPQKQYPKTTREILLGETKNRQQGQTQRQNVWTPMLSSDWPGQRPETLTARQNKRLRPRPPAGTFPFQTRKSGGRRNGARARGCVHRTPGTDQNPKIKREQHQVEPRS